jgi:hypothetical protein
LGAQVKKFNFSILLSIIFSLSSFANVEHHVFERQYGVHNIFYQDAKALKITVSTKGKVDTCNSHEFGGDFYLIAGQSSDFMSTYHGNFSVMSTGLWCENLEYVEKEFSTTITLPGSHISLLLPIEYSITAEAASIIE